MYTGIKLVEPIFEIGFKAALYGDKAVELAQAADRISGDHDVPIIITPQFVDIAAIAQATSRILVFAQHCDGVEIGRGAGSVLPEAVKAAGAVVASCSTPEPEIQIVKETVIETVVEKETVVETVLEKETVIEEKIVEVTVEPVGTEPPLLADRVASGELPPVKETFPAPARGAVRRPAQTVASVPLPAPVPRAFRADPARRRRH